MKHEILEQYSQEQVQNEMLCGIANELDRIATALETTPTPDIHTEIKKIADTLENSIITKLEPYEGMLVVSNKNN